MRGLKYEQEHPIRDDKTEQQILLGKKCSENNRFQLSFLPLTPDPSPRSTGARGVDEC